MNPIFNAGAMLAKMFKAFYTKVAELVTTTAAATLAQANAHANSILASYNPTGQFVGASETYAGLPTTFDGKPINNGDVSFLSKKDGVKLAGIYGYNASTSTWDFLSKVAIDATDIIATEQEVIDGTSTTKAISALHVKQFYANINGSESQLFKASDAHANTKEVVNASQFEMALANEFTFRAWMDWKQIGTDIYKNIITQTAAAFTATPVTEAYLNARINQAVTGYQVITNSDGTKTIVFSNSGYQIKRQDAETGADGIFLVNMGVVGYLKLSYLTTAGTGGVNLFLCTDNEIDAIFLPIATNLPATAFQNGNGKLQGFIAPSLTGLIGESALDDSTLFTSVKTSEFYYNVGAVPNTDADVLGWLGQVATNGAVNLQ